MIKGIALGFLLALVALAATGYAILSTGAIPANADTKPGSFENYVANTSLEATLKSEAPKQSDPVAPTDRNLIAGIHLFADHCAICHGTAAGNDSASAIAKGEYPKPPQLASEGVEDDPAGWTFWKIKHGIRWTGMPSWKYELDDRQIWTLALFLKHMGKLPPAAEAAWRTVGSKTGP